MCIIILKSSWTHSCRWIPGFFHPLFALACRNGSSSRRGLGPCVSCHADPWSQYWGLPANRARRGNLPVVVRVYCSEAPPVSAVTGGAGSDWSAPKLDHCCQTFVSDVFRNVRMMVNVIHAVLILCYEIPFCTESWDIIVAIRKFVSKSRAI